MKYEVVIGLEIHIQLKTKSKMFCRCSAETWNERPNSHTCPVCLGLPGALPVPNQKAVEQAILIGLALHCKPQRESKFDRKNYFYPDLPKGFQISQYDLPFSQGGWVEIEAGGKRKKIGVTRAHLEEDTGKLVHANVNNKRVTLIDFNRSGIPLIEIVSEPDLRTPQEAKEYAQKIQQVVRYLGVSDADMEKGSLRVDVNVSLRKAGERKLGVKAEVKNVNSFRSVERALEHEIKRQTEILAHGGKIEQETRGWLEDKQKTVSQRTKEFAHDYRYFPEPDLPPFEFAQAEITRLEKLLPELPMEKMARFIRDYSLPVHDAQTLVSDRTLADFYESTVSDYLKTDGLKGKGGLAKKVANWITGEFLRKLNESGQSVEEVKITPGYIAELLYLLDQGKITAQAAKVVFSQMFDNGQRPSRIISEKGLGTISTTVELQRIVEDVLKENQKAVEDYKKGKKESLAFLIGQVMGKTQGKAEIKITKELLLKKLLDLEY